MAQSKILVDTNSYLRLAKPLQPFLFEPFEQLPELGDMPAAERTEHDDIRIFLDDGV